MKRPIINTQIGKEMKTKILATLGLLLLFASSCDSGGPFNSVRFGFFTSSSKPIFFLFPVDLPNAPYKTGNMHDLSPDDTTSNSAYRVGFSYVIVHPQEKRIEYSGFRTIEEMSPYDTVRFFVFNGSYFDMPQYNPNDWWHLLETESYLCRYDLTSKDLHSLADSNGDIVIEFPPSEKMKGMKMFPAYKEVRNTFCE